MKTDRHKKILELIDRYEIGTQEELAKILNDEGYNVTQATVSRDIRELNLSKVSVDGKRTRYATLTKDKPVASDKFLTVLKEGFVSMDMAQNILVIKTAPGMAMAVCAAIDLPAPVSPESILSPSSKSIFSSSISARFLTCKLTNISCLSILSINCS